MTTTIQVLLWRRVLESPWPMMAFLLLLGTFSFFFGEKVPAGGGLGWDGLKYAEMVRSLPAMIDSGQLNSYYAQRIVPPMVVRWLLVLSGSSVDEPSHVIRGFEIYNLVLLMLACWAWHRISAVIKLKLDGRWIGFAGMFVTYESSKQAFYYPVLTDVTAMFVAVLMLQFYVTRRPVALLVTTLVGAFVWPIVNIIGACLILLPYTGSKPDYAFLRSGGRTTHSKRITAVCFIAFFVVLGAAMAGYLKLTGGNVDLSTPCRVPSAVTEWLGNGIVPCTWEALLTGLPALLGAAIALAALLGTRSFRQSVLTELRHLSLLRIVEASAAILVPYVVTRILSNPALENPSGLRYMLEYMVLPPAGKFLLPLVTLAVFWGPILLIMLIRWRQFSIAIARLGPGAVAAVAFSIPLALANEPRFITVAWPFCVLGTVMMINGHRVGKGFAFAFATLAVLFAQFWMPLNLEPWHPPDHAGLFEFPKQMYFMHYGLWMNWLSYGVQAVSIALASLWLNAQIGSAPSFTPSTEAERDEQDAFHVVTK